MGVSALVPQKVPPTVERAVAALDALDFGLIASSREVAAMAATNYKAFRRDDMAHPALAPYRFKSQTNGSSILWGNKESIKKLIEANAQ